MTEVKCCRICQILKPLDDFHKAPKEKLGRAGKCKACTKSYSADWFKINAEKTQANTKRYVENAREFVWEYKLSNACSDCEESNPIVLEFDHLKDKQKSISAMVGWGLSIETIKAEIRKCELVCANCHRIRTFKRGKFWPTGRLVG